MQHDSVERANSKRPVLCITASITDWRAKTAIGRDVKLGVQLYAAVVRAWFISDGGATILTKL